MRKVLRICGALALAACVSFITTAAVAAIGSDPADIGAAVLAVIASPNSFLAWWGVINLGASLLANAIPTPDREKHPVAYWAYRIAVDLPALNGPRAKLAVPILAPFGLALALTACAGTTGTGAVDQLRAAYAAAERVNDTAQKTEATVCTGWGLIYGGWKLARLPVPASVAPAVDAVSVFCSGDPAIGSTPLETLDAMAAKVREITATLRRS